MCWRILRALVVPLGLMVVAPACDDGTGPTNGATSFDYSFENGLAGWETRATDIMVGGQPVTWEIATTTDRADEGSRSLRLHLENLSDAGKIWIERGFSLAPNTTYDVDVRYAFGTSDFGSVNLWTIITGAFSSPPSTTAELQPAFQGNTAHGGGSAGFQWVSKQYQLTATTDASGMLYVVIGVWGTFEVTRTYYVDDVRITFTPE